MNWEPNQKRPPTQKQPLSKSNKAPTKPIKTAPNQQKPQTKQAPSNQAKPRPPKPTAPQDDIVCGNRAGALTVLLDVEGAHAGAAGAPAGEAAPTHVVHSMDELRRLLLEKYELLPPLRDQAAAAAAAAAAGAE